MVHHWCMVGHIGATGSPRLPDDRPFLLLASRLDDEVADEEYESYLRFTGLRPRALRRIRMEAGPLPAIDLDGIAGVILGGSPFTTTKPFERKCAVERRVETEMRPLLVDILRRDVPFLGVCYGIGTMGTVAGGAVDARWAESTAAVEIRLTEAGAVDDVARALPSRFTAFVGHTEAMTRVPPGAAVLATSDACPVQLLRLGRHIYLTQFHPEMSNSSMTARIHAYRDHGYFEPSAMEDLLVAMAAARVADSHAILPAWVEHARRTRV